MYLKMFKNHQLEQKSDTFTISKSHKYCKRHHKEQQNPKFVRTCRNRVKVSRVIHKISADNVKPYAILRESLRGELTVGSIYCRSLYKVLINGLTCHHTIKGNFKNLSHQTYFMKQRRLI